MGERDGYLQPSRERGGRRPSAQLYLGGTLTIDEYLYLRQGYSLLTQSLDDCFLGGEPRCQMPAGPVMAGRVREFPLTEDPLGQTGAPTERRLDSIDLDQVDADSTISGHRLHGYSTVTVLARLRG